MGLEVDDKAMIDERFEAFSKCEVRILLMLAYGLLKFNCSNNPPQKSPQAKAVGL
jgi:hypothetical protein